MFSKYLNIFNVSYLNILSRTEWEGRVSVTYETWIQIGTWIYSIITTTNWNHLK
jgi:hypothetical protein